MSKILSWASFALGFALIICGWLLWGNREQTDVLVLNIVVSLVMYCLLFSDMFISWFVPGDKSQRRIGNLGLKWGVIWFYIIISILIIWISAANGWPFLVQLLLHGVALAILLAGFAFVSMSSKNIGAVQQQQDAVRSGVESMRREARALYNDAMDKGTISAELTKRMSALVDDMRFISPANSEEAYDLEKRFVENVSRARLLISSFTMNEEELAMELSKLERILRERKSVYSN